MQIIHSENIWANCEFGRHLYIVFELQKIIHLVEVIELTLKDGGVEI